MTVKRAAQIEELLYQCIRELAYVQELGTGLAATSTGADLIREGMELLGVADLSAETLAGAPLTDTGEQKA